MLTVTVQIGNTDEKLSRVEWVQFVCETHDAIEKDAHALHFSGHSSPIAPWQNSAWVFEIEQEKLDHLKDELRIVREKFRQDSIAFSPAPYTLFL